MSSDIEIAFNELFFGSGSWLGLLILLVIIVAMTLRSKYVGLLMLPVCILLGIDYITENLLWNSIIMLFTSIFILINVIQKED